MPTTPSHSFGVPPFWATICGAFELSIRQADRVAGSDWKAKIENEPYVAAKAVTRENAVHIASMIQHGHRRGLQSYPVSEWESHDDA